MYGALLVVGYSAGHAIVSRVWIPGRVFFIPGNRESGNVIPGRPGMAFTGEQYYYRSGAMKSRNSQTGAVKPLN